MRAFPEMASTRCARHANSAGCWANRAKGQVAVIVSLACEQCRSPLAWALYLPGRASLNEGAKSVHDPVACQTASHSAVRPAKSPASASARGRNPGWFSGVAGDAPTFPSAGGDLPMAFTPVYPTVADLPQAYLRRAVQGGLARAELADTLPLETLYELGLYPSWYKRKQLSF